MIRRRISAKDFLKKIEKITIDRMAQERVVDLQSLRSIRRRNSEPRTLLLIEDDDTVRKALRRIFEDDGIKVLAATDGTELSTLIEGAVIDLVVLDVELPWIDGFEIAQLMKEHPQLKRIPLVFISGRNSDADVKRGFQVGADDYITKPFDVDKVKKSVQALMRLNS